MILLPKSKAVSTEFGLIIKFDYKSLIMANVKISKVVAMFQTTPVYEKFFTVRKLLQEFHRNIMSRH